MKKIIVGLMAALMLTACSKVPAGYVGVKIYMLGSDKGVDTEELSPGRYWIGYNEDLEIFPTFTQNYVWTQSPSEGSENDESITFQDRDGLEINADIGISYYINPQDVSLIFQKYRRGIEEITDVYLRNMVRDAFVAETSIRRADEIYGDKKEEVIRAVEERVRAQVSNIGIVVEKIYYVGSLRLPDSVVAAISNKIQADQIAQQRRNEVAQSVAKAESRLAESRGEAAAILEVAKAQAEANRILAESLTKDLVDYKAVEKWNGQLPKFTGDSAVPFINVQEE